MNGDYVLRCMLCGETAAVSEREADRLRAAKEGAAYICELCRNRVRYESERRRR